jgi:ferritin-like metal-binding protein YciE
MRDRTVEDQLTKYLADVHSIEVQALAQMRAAPKLAGGSRLAAAFSAHLDETAEHERLVRAELERRGADPSTLKDMAGRVGGWAMVAFARLNPDTPGKLAAHAFSYEHMELAAYQLLRRTAQRTQDEAVIALADVVGGQERAMAERLAECFDEAVDASLAQKGDPAGEQLASYLTDARAIEAQAAQLLDAGTRTAGVPALADVFRDHLAETREHQVLLEQRLHARGAKPSRFQNTALRLGAVNLGVFFAAPPDTPVKLAHRRPRDERGRRPDRARRAPRRRAHRGHVGRRRRRDAERPRHERRPLSMPVVSAPHRGARVRSTSRRRRVARRAV